MTDLLLGGAVLLLLGVTAWRVTLAVRSLHDFPRSWAKIHLAVSMALVTVALGTKIAEPGLADVTGLVGLDDTVRHLAVIGVAMSLHSYLIAVRREELRSRDDGKHLRIRNTLAPGQGTQIAGVVLGLVFVVSWIVSLNPTDPVGARALVAGVKVAYGCYVGWVLAENVIAAVAMWRLEISLPDSAQDAGRRWMTGLLGLGSAIAGVYAATRIIVGLAQLAGGADWIDPVQAIGLQMAMLGIAVAVAGVVMPAFVPEGPSRYQLQRQVRVLTPLWDDLTTAYPAGRLEVPPGPRVDQLLHQRYRQVQDIAELVNTLELREESPDRLAAAIASAKTRGFPLDGNHQRLVGGWDDLLVEVAALAEDYVELGSSSAGGKP